MAGEMHYPRPAGNEVFKAVPWDQIRTIEITNIEEKEEQPITVFKNEAIHPR